MSNALVPVDPNNEAGIAESLMHYFTTDTKQARYLSFRVAGYSAREARKLTPVAYDTVKAWREKDSGFSVLERDKIHTLRRRFRKEIVIFQFFRNLLLTFELDANVLLKAALGEELTSDENLYLRNIRKIYTPQQLMALEASVQPESEAGSPFAKLLRQIDVARRPIVARETRREVEIRPE